MGGFLRRGGTPGRRVPRWLAVLGVVVAVLAAGAIVVNATGLTGAHQTASTRTRPAVSAAAGSPEASAAPPASTPAASSSPAGSTVASALRQIILPDVLIVAPDGLSAGQLSALRAISGVRSMLSFDGAEITAGGTKVSVIGVNPATFRSWVPLKTASDQSLWSALASGEFVADSPASQPVTFTPGHAYQLAGASTQTVKFASSATLGLTGVDLVVNQALSARLGLVRQVAGLISAPGVPITTLQSRVAAVLGPSGKIEVLRSQQLPVSSASPGQPSTYLELFKDSAADYCPGLSWTVLAAIGQIESADGQNMGPSSAGALGPMQFLPSTWKTFGITAFGQSGAPDIMNPYDAVPSAAKMLCADGAAGGGTALSNAIFDYNHSDTYVRDVLSLAAQYAADYQ